ncbi:MAG: phosphate ABC transporter, permease protein PstA, partial [Thermodesulfobacteriota bacterium]|nr:phosphate ABC transporter, permease protein PstA [Thermodesulfobacteriota bacterium]
MNKIKYMNKYWRVGEPMVWLSGAALTVTLLTAIVLLGVIMVNGLGVFWPSELQELKLKDGSQVIGQLVRSEPTADKSGLRHQYKIANRDLYGLDFRWIDEDQIVSKQTPDQLLVLERIEHGDFYGDLKSLDPGTGQSLFASVNDLSNALEIVENDLGQLSELEDKLKDASYRMEQIRLKILKYDYKKVAADDPARQKLIAENQSLSQEFGGLVELQTKRTEKLRQAKALFIAANGQEKEIVLADIFQVYAPNQMSTGDKGIFYLKKLGELFVGEPRESNTEGGLFPAIFGTVMLIFVMSLFSFPLGVIAAISLRE